MTALSHHEAHTPTGGRIRRRLSRLKRRVFGARLPHSRLQLLLNSPIFSSEWYLDRHPDIANSPLSPAEHYILRGHDEGRQPSIYFDSVWYRSQLGSTKVDENTTLLEHFLHTGWKQGLDPHPVFQTSYYLSSNPDVADAGFNPLEHYILSGWLEGRKPHPLFDPAWGSRAGEDQAERSEPLAEFLAGTGPELNDPSPGFSVRAYLEANPDVADSGINPLVHFITAGKEEGRFLPPHGSTGADRQQSSAALQRAPGKRRATSTAQAWSAPMPDLFETRTMTRQSRVLMILQLERREDASQGGRLLASMQESCDVIALTAPHLVHDLEEYFPRYRRKAFLALQSVDGTGDARVFSHLLSSDRIYDYESVFWCPEPRSSAVPPQAIKQFASRPDTGVLSRAVRSSSEVLSDRALRTELSTMLPRIGSGVPASDFEVPCGQEIMVRPLILRALRALRPHPPAFVAASRGQDHLTYGRDLAFALIGALAHEGGYKVERFDGSN